MNNRTQKSPNAKLDYTFLWSKWLDGDTIASAVWTAQTGIVIAVSPAASYTSTTATVWLEGGVHGVDYLATCRITTTAGRIDERSILVAVRDGS